MAHTSLEKVNARRRFLKRASTFSMLGAVPWTLNLATLGSASATVAGDYKALVCVFLYGGNDGYNTVLATDDSSWQAYTKTRSIGESIALLPPGSVPDTGAVPGSPARLGGVLPISPRSSQGRSFALNPVLSNVQRLFRSNRLGIVANVGPLLRPTTKLDLQDASFARPDKLFSHNDQISTWQAFAPEGAPVGWGGLMADQFWSPSEKANLFMAVSGMGNAIWLSGRSTLQYPVSNSGLMTVGKPMMFGSASTSSPNAGLANDDKSVYATLLRLTQQTNNHTFLDQDYTALMVRAIEAEKLLTAHLQPANQGPWSQGTDASSADPLQYLSPITGQLEANPLAQQFQTVARMIQAGSDLGLKRQVFLVGMPGFDTHDNQNRTQVNLLARLDHGLSYFDQVLNTMQISNQVTTFTASDFGRGFVSNGDGTDHGWGNHHFVMGGAVQGGEIYGRFPQYSVLEAGKNEFASPDQLHNGVLLPSISVDQYAYTLGRWFGISDGALGVRGGGILPNLSAFKAETHNLGFMG